jgi:hypothetical protein
MVVILIQKTLAVTQNVAQGNIRTKEINLDMCYSVHFHKVLINTPANAQLILLYND